MMNLLIVFLLGDPELHFLTAFLFGGTPSSIFLMFFFLGLQVSCSYCFLFGKGKPNKKMETGVPKEKTIRTFSMASSQIFLLFPFWGIRSPKSNENPELRVPKEDNNTKMEPGVPKKENIKKMKLGVSQRENR